MLKISTLYRELPAPYQLGWRKRSLQSRLQVGRALELQYTPKDVRENVCIDAITIGLVR